MDDNSIGEIKLRALSGFITLHLDDILAAAVILIFQSALKYLNIKDKENLMEDISVGDYVVLETQKGATWAGRNLGNMEINGKNGRIVSLQGKDQLVIWCDNEYINKIYSVIKE